MKRMFAGQLWLRLLLLCVLAIAYVESAAAETLLKTEANVRAEVTLISQRPHVDPFNTVTLDVIFTEPSGRQLRVPAFWAGSNVWKARYASPLLGSHSFRSECSDNSDPGLHEISGRVVVTKYTGTNSLYQHGPLRVSANQRYLEHADNAPFFWLGDTWWMGLCHRLQWPDEFKTLAADRKTKGFNVIQLVAGLYPDMHPFDARGTNEAGFPWETNYARLRPEYFNAADERIEWLVDQGFTPCIVGAWGYFIRWMGVEKANQHWRNLIARYGAMPVVWCVAGEANLPWYLAEKFPYDDREQVKQWTEVARYIRSTDPFRRPLTIHPTGIGRLSARNAIDDPALLDFDMLQTPHGEREAVAPTVRTVRESYADTPVMPVINGEASYEMLNGRIAAAWPRAMFWVCMLNGAAGHTYGANGIWQCNREGQPHGPSPTRGSPPTGYGATPWNEAMNFPGSRQVAAGKKLLEQFAWQRFEPHPEWADFADEPQVSLNGAEWIWFPEGTPAHDALTEERYFRKLFVLPTNQTPTNATLFVTADDWVSVALNGVVLGASSDWRNGLQLDVTRSLRGGTNVLTAIVRNLPAAVPNNPAGFLCALDVRTGDEVVRVTSDATWRCATNAAGLWTQSDFDDDAWSRAKVLGRYGIAPWGRLSERKENVSPQATGIGDEVRVVYASLPRTVRLRHLQREKFYRVSWFDPVSGERHPLRNFSTDSKGTFLCPAPEGIKESDWVLIVEVINR